MTISVLLAATLAIFMGLLIAAIIWLSRSNNAFEREADEARTALVKSKAALQSKRTEQREKDSLIAAASHDLRQPLHALGMFLASIETQVDNKQGRETLHDAIECSNNIGTLLNSLLDLSRLDAGVVKVESKHFRLRSLVAMLLQEFQAKTSSEPINIQVHIADVVVNSDPILLSRIIRNLIENAVVHSGADAISVTCIENNHEYRLSITDNGCGIPANEQKDVFSEHYQIDNQRSGPAQGLGLGLSIVSRLAALLKMRIALDSEIGVSTTFTMDIPAGESYQIDELTNSTSVSGGTRLYSGGIVAVIDDDERTCVAMSSMLRSIGLEAVTATTIDALINKLIESNKTPGLIVADYRLRNGRTGNHAIVQLRRALNLDIPGLLITADTSSAGIAEATQSGFEYLLKPVQPVQFAEKINELLTITSDDCFNSTEVAEAKQETKVV